MVVDDPKTAVSAFYSSDGFWCFVYVFWYGTDVWVVVSAGRAGRVSEGFDEVGWDLRVFRGWFLGHFLRPRCSGRVF